MKVKKALMFFAVVFLFNFPVCGDLVEKVGKDVFVNWTEGTITATGIGYPSAYSEDANENEKKLQARQAAKTDAIRKLAEGIGNVRVDGVTVVKDLMKKNDVVRTKIKAFVRNCAEKKVEYLEDGGCKVTVVASLNGKGSLSHIVYDSIEIVDKSKKEKPVKRADEKKPSSKKTTEKIETAEKKSEKKVSEKTSQKEIEKIEKIEKSLPLKKPLKRIKRRKRRLKRKRCFLPLFQAL